MRDDPQAFCPVCDGYICDTLLPLSGFKTLPADLEPDVDPWPASLRWTAGQFESEWRVQITDQPDFSGQVQEFTTTKVDIIDGKKAGYEEVWLTPGKQYRWRVRKVTDPVLNPAWTQPRTFNTTPKKVKLHSPGTVDMKGSRDRSGVKYPWGLVFDWYEVDGAYKYEVEVLDSSNTPIFPAVKSAVHALSVTLDVKVKANLHWHARAIPTEGTGYEGVWSDSFWFVTSWPKVTISKPGNGKYQYPWPVTLEWNKVDGAAKYKVEIERKKDQWGLVSQQKKLAFDQPTTSVDLNLKPRRNSDHEAHTWKVRVWGPPPLNEEGEDSGLYTFYNRGDKTAPMYSVQIDAEVGESGAEWPTSGFRVHNSGGDVYWAADLHWGRVDGATEYHLYLRPWNETDGPGNNALLPKVPVDAAHPPQHPHLKIRTDQEDLNPPPGVGVEAYRWDVWAIGPEDLKGLSLDDVWHKGGESDIEPDVPVAINPPKDATEVDPDNLGFSFTSEYTPSGKYRVQLQGQNLHDATIPGNPGGETSFAVGVFGLSASSVQHGTTYQWRVRAFSDHGEIDDLYAWGPWWKFATASAAQPPPAPNPICPTGGEQIPGTSLYVAWSEVPRATQYKFVITPPPFFSNSGELTYNLNELDSIENGRVLLALGYDVLEVNTQYQWMVRANVNGVWSESSPEATFVSGPSHGGDWNTDCSTNA